MSAFAGLLVLDGTPCPQPVVEAMLARLRHRVAARGWAARQVRCGGSIGLGYAPLITAPEAVQDIERPDQAQTLTHNGLSLWMTSDVRLDGRVELTGELGLNAKEAREWSDGRLILESYARWGSEAPQRLRGDFAFAIWDAPRHRLFCARDRFGTKPFYYAYKAGQFFAFANEIKALWPVPGLDAGVNETQIANYLLARYDDKTSTFYQGVRRLSPASWMEISLKQSGEARENLYWELDAERELLLPSDEDYAAMLREGFTASVRERMRCDGKFAVFLSGGLDSSSVAAVAERETAPSQRPLASLSTVFDRFPQCDERAFIHQTLKRGEFEPIWLVGDDLTPLRDIERVVWHLDQPAPGPNTCSAWAQYGVLQQHGFSAVVDGHGGDEVVFMGYERVGELLRQGQFLTAWRELRALRRHGLIEKPSPAFQVWKGLLWHARSKRGLGRLVSRWETAAKRRRGASLPKLTGDEALFELAPRLLSPELAAKTEARAPEISARTLREQHGRVVGNALQPLALELLDSMAGAHAIESRCPFWEQRLVEMCLAFPSDQKMRGGSNRYVMRRAMQGYLAPQVQWRHDKTNFSPQISEALRVNESDRVERLLQAWESAVPHLASYVALDEARLHWMSLQRAAPSSTEASVAAALLWRVLCLGVWLSQDHHNFSPMTESIGQPIDAA